MTTFDSSGAYPITDRDLTALHRRLTAEAAENDVLDVAYRTVDSPIGTLLLAATPRGLVRLAFGSEGTDRVLQDLADRISPRVLAAPRRLDNAAKQLDDYFAGRRHSFDLPLDWQLCAGFRRTVVNYLANDIDYGQIATYRELATLAGSPNAVRAVGTACTTNDPCRRPLPPRRPLRRHHGRLSRRPERQARSPHLGALGMTTRTGDRPNATTRETFADRVDEADWARISADLDDVGAALIGALLTPAEAGDIAALYDDLSRFRSTVDMARHRFGRGQYRYFAEPFPDAVVELKHALYPRLLLIAREWWTRLGRETPWPDTLDQWLQMCHAGGQTKPTPILLQYGEGDWNALHRDLYGDLVFPMQVVINLNNPGVDHTGGEFLLYEQRPRAQSRGNAFTIPHGHGLAFTTRDRPVPSARGWSAAPVRHGVSTIRSGKRHTLGLVFHDAA